MAGGVGQRMRLRLFIEGVEVPVIAAQVNVVPNSPAACSIQIPPLVSGTNIFPRSLVHLFFLDFYEMQSPFTTQTGAPNTNTNQSPTAYENVNNPAPLTVAQAPGVGDAQDIQNARYKLLFGGEVVGFQWTKNASNRSLVLQCQDWSNYWDYAYQWNNTDLFGPGVKAMFSGGSTNLFTDFLEDEGSAIIRIIQTPSVQYPNLKGLLGGIVHLLEAIGGSYYQGKQFAGENIFFSLAELRLHITQMITAYENDPTASRLLAAGYDSLLGRTLGDLGQQVSIRQAINALMGIIFHETYAQCCPLYVPGSGNVPSGKTQLSVRQDADSGFIATNADGLLQSISQVQSTLSSPSGAGTSDEQQAAVLASLSAMKSLCDSTTNMITGKTVAGAKSYYASASRSLAQAQAKARNWRPGANPNIVSSINSDLSNAQTNLQKASNFTVSMTTKQVVAARLNQQIFRPDVWFSAPPCCNVIFPEHYNSLNYARSFLQEPTRLLLKTNDEFFGEDELFDQFYFAPKGFTLKTGGRELQNILSNDLLDHELFSGILPVFEKMGELNIFAARSGTVNGKVPKIGLAQRSCNFLYFKYRFAARQLTLSGKFNPYLACGFPALVIDKYVDQDTITLRQQLLAQSGGPTPEINQLLGAHFLCNLTEVSHNVSQNDGTTTLNCSYARQPEESVEFLGVLRQDQTVHKRFDTDATRVSVVAAVDPPSVNSLGPNLGNITAVQDVTAAYSGQDLSTAQKLPLYQGPARAGTTQASLSVPIGITAAAGDYGQGVVSLIGNPTALVTFRAYRITESIPRYRKETVDLPAEEYIRPGWYGDIWAPAKIGQAYQQFFQTSAITDQRQVTLSNFGSVGVQGDQAQQALSTQQQAVDADDPNANAPGLLALDSNSTIQDAVAFIVETYSLIKQQPGLDVDEYIRSYNWRPIASLVDLFGSSDLVLDQTGQHVVQGIEGFHSRAFGPYSDLFGLVTPDIENILGIKRGSTTAQKGDTRGRKQKAVADYVAALQFARAILG
jgi:hypothetical protein